MDKIFGFIIHPMEIGLVALAVAVGSAGIGIILFTILVRLVLSPLQITQLRNAKAMQRVQPLLQEIRKKHGSDRQKMSEETMKLYREHRVNPAMGCLPTLLQFPILIGLFYALMHLGSSPTGYPNAIDWAKSTCNGHHVADWAQWFNTCYAFSGLPSKTTTAFNLFHAKFLWLNKGLGEPDPFYILPLLAGITQWIQSRMMLVKSTDPQQQTMNTMMNFMPLMIIFFALRYASGLSLYWVTSTMIGIAIQYRITGWGLLPDTLRSVGLIRSPKPAPRGGSGARPVRNPNQNKSAPSSNGKSSSNGSGNGATPESTMPVVTGNADTTGTNDDAKATRATPGEGSNTRGNGAAPTPRKRANRAKGGRGGRRG